MIIFFKLSINLEKLVPASMLIQRILHTLHDGNYLLLLQSPSNDLHCYGKTGHGVGVVVLVCALRDAVEPLELECRGQGVFCGVDVRDGDDATAVVELERSAHVGLCNLELTRLKRNV